MYFLCNSVMVTGGERNVCHYLSCQLISLSVSSNWEHLEENWTQNLLRLDPRRRWRMGGLEDREAAQSVRAPTGLHSPPWPSCTNLSFKVSFSTFPLRNVLIIQQGQLFCVKMKTYKQQRNKDFFRTFSCF